MFLQSIIELCVVPARRLGLGLCTIFFCAASVRAQVQIVPNVTYDGYDYDLTDGVCDVDQLMPGLQCTLRAALQNANMIGGAVTIQLGPAIYPLTVWGTDDASKFGDLDVNSGLLSALVIQGAGPATVIDAAPLAGQGFPDRVLEIVSLPGTATVELHDLVLTGGRAGGAPGGAIRHRAGTLELTNVAIQDCQGSDGAGLRVDAPLSMVGGNVHACVALGASSGGGAFVQWAGSPKASFSGVVFDGNSATKGAGLRIAVGASVAATGCTFQSNTASSSGGGADVSGTLTASQTSFFGNSANTGGGISIAVNGGLVGDLLELSSNTAAIGAGINIAGGTLVTLSDSTVESNTAAQIGGGIANSGTLNLQRSTIDQNVSNGSGGAGIHSFGVLTADLCTISGNVAFSGSGGGCYLLGAPSKAISACTIAYNHSAIDGAGIFTDVVFGPVNAQVKSTILDANDLLTGAFNPRNFGGTAALASGGFNLDSDGTCGFASASDQSGTISSPLSAQLATLASNGGPTQTHAMLPCTSPAVDHGDCTTIAGLFLSTDQRGFPRVGPCDVGSFESQTLGCQPGVPYCFGDGSLPTACPCGNTGAPGRGCNNSAGTGGASLSASGVAQIAHDTVQLIASHEIGPVLSIFLQGDANLSSGLVFGDGVRCVGGHLFRMYIGNADSSGAITRPILGTHPTISAMNAMHGTPIISGTTLYYGVYYRDPNLAFCPNPPGNSWNIGNGYRITWN